MKTFLVLALATVAGLGVVGCDKSERKALAPKTTDLGTGLNAVERSYTKPTYELNDVVAAALKSFDLTVESDTHDDLGGEIVAHRTDGSKVTAKIRAVDADHSDISIRVAPGNRNMAEMIHDRIAEKIGALNAK